MTMQVICDHAKECKGETCAHMENHEPQEYGRRSDCTNKPCRKFNRDKAKCVPAGELNGRVG